MTIHDTDTIAALFIARLGADLTPRQKARVPGLIRGICDEAYNEGVSDTRMASAGNPLLVEMRSQSGELDPQNAAARVARIAEAAALANLYDPVRVAHAVGEAARSVFSQVEAHGIRQGIEAAKAREAGELRAQAALGADRIERLKTMGALDEKTDALLAGAVRDGVDARAVVEREHEGAG